MDDPARPGRFVGPALFAVAAAACALFAARLIAQPVDDLVGFVSDDAFYYLETARHLASTGKPTFDGLHATNGYHPGWMAISTLLAKLVAGRETLLRAALWTSFAIHFATAGLIVRLSRRFVTTFWAWILGALWAVNPLPVTLATQCVEASLALLAWVVAIDVFAARIAGAARPTRRDFVLLGAALGLVFWARTDGALAAVAMLALLPFVVGRAAAPRAVLATGAVAALCALPWFAWSYATTGSFTQDSGAVKMLWADKAFEADGSRSAAAFEFVARQWFGRPSSLLAFAPTVGPILAAAACAVAALSALRALRRGESRTLRLVTVWLALCVAGTGAVYGALFTDQMIWYFGLPGLALFLVGALWIADRMRTIDALRRPALHAAAGAALVVGAILQFSRYRERMPFEYPWQRDVLTSQRAFEAIVPKDARIGSFNAGIPAYFGERTVVNLDGLVNHDLLEVYRRGDLDRWLADERIDFIADEPFALGRAQKLTKNPIRLTRVSSAPLRGWLTPTRFLWKVESP